MNWSSRLLVVLLLLGNGSYGFGPTIKIKYSVLTSLGGLVASTGNPRGAGTSSGLTRTAISPKGFSASSSDSCALGMSLSGSLCTSSESPLSSPPIRTVGGNTTATSPSWRYEPNATRGGMGCEEPKCAQPAVLIAPSISCA